MLTGIDAKTVWLHSERFHEHPRAALASVATGAPSLYANAIVRKGVIHPGGTVTS